MASERLCTAYRSVQVAAQQHKADVLSQSRAGCRAANAFIKKALAEEPSLGVEVYQELASPTEGGTVVIVRSVLSVCSASCYLVGSLPVGVST